MAVRTAGMNARSRARWIWFVVTGVFLAWVGGFLVSSDNDRCVNGPAAQECSGRLASSFWHTFGLVSVAVGLVLVVAALVPVASTHRHSRMTARWA